MAMNETTFKSVYDKLKSILLSTETIVDSMHTFPIAQLDNETMLADLLVGIESNYEDIKGKLDSINQTLEGESNE